MKALVLGLLAFVFLTGQGIAQGQPSWFSHYLEAEEAGELNVCIAGVAYANAAFLVRLYGEDMDFMYRRDDFTLPYGEALGVVKLWIDGQIYELAAWSFDRTEADQNRTSQRMQLMIEKEEYTAVLNALKFGTNSYLEFPSGSTYAMSLRGSNKALSAAANCWSRNETGPLDNNPFSIHALEQTLRLPVGPASA